MYFLCDLFNLADLTQVLNNTPTTNPPIDLNTILNFILVALGAATLFYMIVASLQQRQKKDVVWELVSDLPLLNIASKVKNRIQVLLDNKPVKDLSLVTIKLRNAGTIEIKDTDFVKQRPFKFSFGEAEVLDAAILKTSSRPLTEDAKACFKWNSRQVLLGPLALNRKDYITMEVLLNKQPPNKIIGETRIYGVSKFRLWSPTKAILAWGSIFIIGGTALGFGLQYLLQSTLPKPINPVIIPLAVFFTLFLKSYNVAVPITFASAYFFKTRKLTSVGSAIFRWTLYSFLFALAGTVPLIFVLIF